MKSVLLRPWSRFLGAMVFLLMPGLARAADHFVNIQNFAFAPTPITIDAADRVIWVNQDAAPHTSTSDAAPPLWGSGSLGFGRTFTNEFKAAGTFTYHCAIHPSMHGTIIVKQAQNQPPTVSLDSPGNGALYLLPATIALSATASDPDGSVTNVEFFKGNVSVGRVSAPPFTLVYSPSTPGVYSFYARATDNLGVSSDSPRADITVTTYNAYAVHALVSDIPGLADQTDTNLANPWGIAFNATGPFWVSDNHSSRSTLYDGLGMARPLVVEVASPGNPSGGGAPTGIVFNSTAEFELAPGLPARFIFCTEDGTLCGWNQGSTAAVRVDRSAFGSIYKGVALVTSTGGSRLYVADFHNARIEVFDGQFAIVSLSGSFNDPALPAGYAPFNVVPFRGHLLVTYALQDADREDDDPGPGRGLVNEFDLDGNLLRRFASQGPLNSPWGVVEAPAGFGEFSQTLLIGNFGDGRINAFNADTGAWLESLESENGEAMAIEGLWDLKFGNGHAAGDTPRLYFTAGISGGGGLEDHGLLGVISAVPAIEIQTVERQGDSLVLTWAGGFAPYKVQRRESLNADDWSDAANTSSQTATVPLTNDVGLFRVVDAGNSVGTQLTQEVWCRTPR